jgi:hypothetical protein
MKAMMILLFLAVKAEDSKPTTKVERISIDYKGKAVKAKKLTVSSEIPMEIDVAWNNVKSPELLKFVAKGMIGFKSTDGGFPKNWEVGQTYGVKIRIFGFIPFGGTHYLHIEKIDEERKEIATREWDKEAKVWNHHVVMKDLGNGNFYYEDDIIIYGGWKTGVITSFAKRFYKHRQKRWQIVAKENLNFG